MYLILKVPLKLEHNIIHKQKNSTFYLSYSNKDIL